MDAERRAFLDNLRAGDPVVIGIRFQAFSARVQRVTAHQIIVKGERYRRSDGGRMGEGPYCDHAKVLHPVGYTPPPMPSLIRGSK